jgi:hypothetical protein
MKTIFYLALFAFLNFSFVMPTAESFKNDVQIVVYQQNADDIQIVMTVYTNLFAAQDLAKQLNVNVIVSETNSDLLFFAINSEEQKELAIKIFDEEGFETVANTSTKIEIGNNYKAINIKTLEDGAYIFELSNADGESITQKIYVDNE